MSAAIERFENPPDPKELIHPNIDSVLRPVPEEAESDEVDEVLREIQAKYDLESGGGDVSFEEQKIILAKIVDKLAAERPQIRPALYKILEKLREDKGNRAG